MKPIDLSRLNRLREETEQAGAAMDAMRPRFDALRTRHEDGTAPQAVSSFQLFQTPVALARELVSLLQLQRGARVLEPSAGLGRILDELKPFDPSEVVAIDSAADCTGFLFRQDRERVRILQRDFLDCTPEDLGTFDAIAMNPPFHMRSDVRHILHARKFLKPGGRLAAICMNTHHRATALRPYASHWQELPESTFTESNTRVPTVLLCIDAPAAKTEGVAS